MYQPIPQIVDPIPYAAAYLTDADATVEPFTDKIGIYILRAGTLTANRVLQVNNTNGLSTWEVQIAVYDLSAHTYTINSSTPATIYTKGASPGRAILYQLYSAAGAAFVANVARYIRPL
jgi:hypothetical protein